MKPRSASLDDVWGELTFVLDDDRRLLARVTRRVFAWTYRTLKTAMLVAIRLPWRHGSRFPELGAEPFNLTDTELEREWRQL
jgi:hypothetical protein